MRTPRASGSRRAPLGWRAVALAVLCGALPVVALDDEVAGSAAGCAASDGPAYDAGWRPGQALIHFDRQAADRLHEAMAAARRHIDVSTFLLGGGFGRDVLRTLDRQARRGVRVRLIYADPGNIGAAMAVKRAWLRIDPLPAAGAGTAVHFEPAADEAFAGELAGSPIERRRFPLGQFPVAPMKLAHDKLLIVDGEHAFAGGLNLDSVALGNHDALIEVAGPAAAAAAAVFEQDWRRAAGPLESASTPQPEPRVGPPDVAAAADARWPERLRFAVTRPGCENQHALMLELLAGARRRAWVQMFYLTEPRLVQALVAAHRRGVDVRVIVDPNDYSLGLRMRGLPNVAQTTTLRDAGVPLRLYASRPGEQMHQKTLLVDGQLAFVGSTNWTRQSFRVNTESGYLVDSRAQAEALAARFTEDWERRSRPVDGAPGAGERAWSALARLVSRYL